MTATEPNYTIITSDSHAGGSHEQYREYLDPAWRDEFDAWREKYKNPWKDLRDTDLRVRSWDDDRRNADQLSDGVVGEVIFPNTVPPFYPGFVLFAGPPKDGEEYERRRAGIHAHNRWMVDFCGRQPERRAGIGQIFLNDIDDAIEDATWIKENGLRGGVLIPTVAPDVKWVKPIIDPVYDRLWAHLVDLDMPVHLHGGTGSPNYGKYPATQAVMIAEVPFYGLRNYVHMLLAGVFERYPTMKFVITEAGSGQFKEMNERLDRIIKSMAKGAIGELKYAEGSALPRLASEYFEQNVWLGASFPSKDSVDMRHILGEGRFMWGSDYPHDEGTPPFTREHLRQVMLDVPVEEKRRLLGLNAADLYDFDVEALAPLVAEYGPTVAELEEPLTELPDGANQALLANAS